MARLSLKTILISGIALVVAWVFISKAIVPWVYLPRDTAKSELNNYESKVGKLEALKVLTENDEHYLAAISRNAFSMDKSEAISRMGVYLTETIKASGLSEDKFTRRPLKATQLAKNGATQIGYTVSGQGSLPKVIDLMFLLEQTPFLPRSTIKSYTQQGGRLTLVTVKPHSFEKGQMVQLRGGSPVNREFPSSYNGVFRVINTDTNPAPMSLTLALPNAGKNAPTATKSLTSNSISATRKKKRNWLTRLIFGDDSKIEPGLAGITKIKGTKQTGNRLTIYTKGNHLFSTGDKVSLQNLTPLLLNKTVEITRDSPTKFSRLLDGEADTHTSAIVSRVIPQRVENITMLPVDGCVFISVKDGDKGAALGLAKKLAGLGFAIIATGGTARHLNAAGLSVRRVNKVLEGRPHCVDAILNGEVQLIINTTESAQAIADSYSIRRTALTDNIPHYTTITGARAAIMAIQAQRTRAARDGAKDSGLGGLEVVPLQTYSKRSA